MKGMESMVASMLGINPQELRDMFESKVEEVQTYAVSIKQQLDRIESNQILLYQLLHHAGLIGTPSEMQAQKALALEAKHDEHRDATASG